MADLGTLAASGLDATNSDAAITETNTPFDLIAAADDNEYAHEDGNNTHSFAGYWDIGSVPTDFASMDTISINLRYVTDTTNANMEWTGLGAAIVDSTTGTLYADNGAGNHVWLAGDGNTGTDISTTTATNTGATALTVTTAGSNATKANWDAAKLEIHWQTNKIKGGGTVDRRVTAAEITGTYTQAGITHQGIGRPEASVTATASGTLTKGGTADSSTDVSATATGAVIRSGVADSSTAATMTATGGVIKPGVADATAAVTMTATGTATVAPIQGIADISLDVAVTGTGVNTAGGVADSSTTVTGTATGSRTRPGVADVSLDVDATATGTVTAPTGAASVRGWYDTSNWYSQASSNDITGVAWEEDDVIVVAFGTANGQGGDPSSATNANLTFTNRELINGTGNECGFGIWTAVAGSAQTNQTITLNNDGWIEHGGCAWVLQNATLTGFQSDSNQTESAITLNPSEGSVVIYFAADWNASTTLGTPETNTGTLTERHDAGDGSSWGAIAVDWADVDAGSDGWGVSTSDYSSLVVGHGVIEVLGVAAPVTHQGIADVSLDADVAGTATRTAGASADASLDVGVTATGTVTSGHTPGSYFIIPMKDYTDGQAINAQTGVTQFEGGANANDMTAESDGHTDSLASHMGPNGHIDFSGQMSFWEANIWDTAVDFDLVCDVALTPDNGANNTVGVVFRNSSATTFTDCYFVALENDSTAGSGTMTLYKRVSSVDTSLGTWHYQVTESNLFWLRIVASGSDIEVQVARGTGGRKEASTFNDDSYYSRIRVTDSSHTSGDYVGLYGQRANAAAGAEPVFGLARFWTYGFTPVVDYNESANWTDETTINNSQAVDWVEGDVVVVAQAAGDGSLVNLNAPTNANLTFSGLQNVDNGIAGEPAVRLSKATAPSTIYGGTILNSKTAGATPFGCAVWVVAGVDTTLTPHTSTTAEEGLTFTGPSVNSTVIAFVADGDGGSGWTGNTNSGTLTERTDTGNATDLGVWAGDWQDVSGTPTGTAIWGLTDYTGTTVAQAGVELRTGSGFIDTPATGPAAVRGYYAVSDWTATTAQNLTGVAWNDGDLVVVIQGVQDGDGTLAAPTNANLTFTEYLNYGDSAFYAGIRVNVAEATSTETAQTISLGIAGGTKQHGGAAWVIQDALGVQNFDWRRDSTGDGRPMSMGPALDGSVVIYTMFDWEAATPGTGLTNTGTFTERTDFDGSNWSVWTGDWEDVDPGPDEWGVSSYAAPRPTHAAIEITGVPAAGAVQGIGDVSAAVTVSATANTTVSGVADVSLAVSATATGSAGAVVSGIADVTVAVDAAADGTCTRSAVAAVTSAATLTASGVRTRNGSADVTAAATITAVGVRTRSATADVSTAATITATGTVGTPQDLTTSTAWWHARDVTGSAVNDQIGTTDLTLVGSPTVGNDGTYYHIDLSFDASTYIHAGDNFDNDGATDQTIVVCYQFRRTIVGVQYIMAKRAGSANGYQLYFSGTTTTPLSWRSDGGTNADVTVDSDISGDEDQYVWTAVGFDGDDQFGIHASSQVRQTATASAGDYSNTEELRFGRGSGATTGPCEMYWYGAAIWDGVVLTDAEIDAAATAIYEAAAIPPIADITESVSITATGTVTSSGFSEDFSAISTGSDIDEDGDWVIHSYGSSGATAKESGGQGRLTTIGGQNPSHITIEPVYTAQDETSELYFELEIPDTTTGNGIGPENLDYDYLVVGVRTTHFDTTGTPSDPWDAQYPYNGWYFLIYPGRDPALELHRSNSGLQGTTLANPDVLPAFESWWGETYSFRFQWEKNGTDDWQLRARAWESSTESEPAAWDIDYQDTNTGTHNDNATGIWAFSASHAFGTVGDQPTDLDNITITDTLTSANEVADVSAAVGITATASVNKSASADVSLDVDVTGVPTGITRQGEGHLAASATLTAAGTVIPPTLSVDVDATGTVWTYESGIADVSLDVGVSATGTSGTTVGAVAAVTAAATLDATATATLAAVADISTDVEIDRAVGTTGGDITGVGAVTVDVTGQATATAQYAASADLSVDVDATATGSRTRPAVADVAADVALSATGSLTRGTTGDLTTDVTVAGTGSTTRSAVAVVSLDVEIDRAVGTTGGQVLGVAAVSVQVDAEGTAAPLTRSGVAGVWLNTGRSFAVYEHYTDDEPNDGAVIGIGPMGRTGTETLPIESALTSWDYRHHWPKPSPDGSKILYARDPKGTLGNTPEEIFVMDRDGRNATRIMSMVSGDQQNNENSYSEWGHHEWVDSDTLVFSGHASGDTTYAIWTCDSDGTTHVRVTDGTELCIDPSITPDGRILYVKGVVLPGTYELWIMDIDGGNDTRLSTDSIPDYDPYASPDGTRIVNLQQPNAWFSNGLRDIDGSNYSEILDGDGDLVSYGVARWVTDDLIISTQSVASGTGYELFTYDPDDASNTKTVILASDASNKYRGVEQFLSQPYPAGAVTRSASGDAAVSATVAASGSVVRGSTATVTVDLEAQASGSVVAAGVATVSVDVEIDRAVGSTGGDITGIADVSLDVAGTAAATLNYSAVADVSLDADLAATGGKVLAGSADLTADVDLTATGSKVLAGVADVTVDADVYGDGTVTRTVVDGQAAVTTAVALQAAGSVTRSAAADASVDVEIDRAVGTTTGEILGVGAVLVDVQLGAAGTNTFGGQADTTVDADVTATGSRTVRAVASVSVGVDLQATASGGGVISGVADVSVSTDVQGTGHRRLLGGGHCTVHVNAQATGGVVRPAVAATTVTVTLAATGTGGTSPEIMRPRAVQLRTRWGASAATPRWNADLRPRWRADLE